jgi:hypothetical protein
VRADPGLRHHGSSAAIVEINANSATAANEAPLVAASRALFAARPTDPRDMAKLLRWARDVLEWDDGGIVEFVARRLEV